MKIGAILTALMLIFASCAIICVDNADAARLGGGKSFGSKPFMNQAAPPPAVRQPNIPRQAPRQTQASPVPQGGMFGGMGGLFTGLLAGSLLGSLFSGSGAGNAAAGTAQGGGFGLLDFLLIGLLVFVAYKLFMRFRQSRSNEPAPAGGLFGDRNFPGGQSPMRGDAGGLFGGTHGARLDNGWDSLRGTADEAAYQANSDVSVPPGFNVDEFLRGAKAAYNRLQKAWDKRDLADIARFSTPAVMRVLEEQKTADPNPSNTEIMLVNAQLAGFEQEGDMERARVYFDVLMRENPTQQQPEDVREIWHFERQGSHGEWKLDGIQQIQ